MTIQEATNTLWIQVKRIYDDRESSAIADRVMENLTNLSKSERIINKSQSLIPEQFTRLQNITEQLLEHKPVQYILNEAWFMGMKFYVNEHVLIPRPETEELVGEVVKAFENRESRVEKNIVDSRLSILDIGTGSGCIAISIKKSLPEADVFAIDISEDALEVARKNALFAPSAVKFGQLNFLEKKERDTLGKFDIIVSNPPYIAEEEKEEIDLHVREYEPHVALFVPTNDSLIFYEAIADFGKTHLKEGGKIFVETSSLRGNEVKQLFEKYDYDTELKKDMHGNDRIVKAERRKQKGEMKDEKS